MKDETKAKHLERILRIGFLTIYCYEKTKIIMLNIRITEPLDSYYRELIQELVWKHKIKMVYSDDNKISIVWYEGERVTSVSKRVLKRIRKFSHLNDYKFEAQEKYIDDSILEEKRAKLYEGYSKVKI